MLLIPELQNFPQEQIGSLVLSDLHAPPEGIVLAGVNSQALLEVNIVHEKSQSQFVSQLHRPHQGVPAGVSCLRATCEHQTP